MAGCCVAGNETSGPIKGEDFLTEWLLPCEEGLCYIATWS
jgi:hypothetical protein